MASMRVCVSWAINVKNLGALTHCEQPHEQDAFRRRVFHRTLSAPGRGHIHISPAQSATLPSTAAVAGFRISIIVVDCGFTHSPPTRIRFIILSLSFFGETCQRVRVIVKGVPHV